MAGAQVRGFGTVAHKAELQEVAGLVDAAEAYVVLAVYLCGVALLDLLEVTGAFLGAAGTDGEGAVGKVDEEFAAVEVVGRDGRARVAAFWDMGQHEDGQVEIGLEGFEVFHEVERYGCVFGTAAQAGDVIDNEHGGV